MAEQSGEMILGDWKKRAIELMKDVNSEQPAPQRNTNPAVWDLVIEDMRSRDRVGETRYGVRLQPHNGRDALMDAYAEALDLCVYMRQAIYERDGK